ncbi:hypothetical protein C6341_g9928 [Phytophthora cactorum]|nr:hypothetical protein C6341_g9928 [Phytophthora cactorum]
MASVRVYVEDPLQQDWDELMERLISAINNSMDTTRKETPFYLVHGWDARSTLRAMTTSMRRGFGRQSEARAWRREASRQQEIALAMAKEYQASEKEKRAKKHNDALSRMEASKPVTDFEDRPTVRLAPEVEEKHRTDFDEELLPENSWEQEPATDEFEVQAILDDRVPVSTGTERPVREFKIKWAGYDESSLEPVSNLSCGGLLYDYPLERNRDRRLQIVQVANEV